MYSFRPIPNKIPTYIIILLLFLIGTALIAFGAWVGEFTGFAVLTFGVLFYAVISVLTIRYLVSYFTYYIGIDKDGYDIFYIVQSMGKNSKVVCNIRLSEITDIKKIERIRGQKGKRKLPNVKIYNYCASIYERVSYVLLANEDEQTVGVHFSTDEKMIGIISKIVNQNKDFNAGLRG